MSRDSPPETVTLDLASLLHGDRVVVTDNLGSTLASLEDPDHLAALAAVLADLGEGWTTPETGVRVARVRLNFSAGQQPHGNLGVGKRFLAAHVHGGFVQRDSDLDTARSILRALGVGYLLSRL